MGIFSNSSPFDAGVEKITDEKNTTEDWGLILDLCDRVSASNTGPRDCLKSIMKRLNHQVPHVVLQAATLLDACINNCGKNFKLEVASGEFERDFKKLLVKAHPKVAEKLKGLLKKWANADFKNDPQLALIPGLYNSLKREGMDFNSSSSGGTQNSNASSVSKNPDAVSSQQEEDDIAKAIQLSLADSKGSPSQGKKVVSQLYPSTNSDFGSNAPSSGPAKEQKKARALYDFEAAEDNELTFKAGEIVIVIDDSDANWWKGSNHRGEGLFPANFVTTDLDASAEDEQPKRRRSVQFNEEVEIKTLPQQDVGPVEISEEKIDNVLMMLNEADPTNLDTDPPDLSFQEEQVNSMGPLIDTELESIDRRHAQLTRISTELVDALNLYHQLMHEVPVQPQMPGGYMMPPQAQYPGAYNPAMYGNPMAVAPMPGTPMPQSQPYSAGPLVGRPDLSNGVPAPNSYPGYMTSTQQMAPNAAIPPQQDQPVPPHDQNPQISGSMSQPYYANSTQPPVTTQPEPQSPAQQQQHFASPMAPPQSEGYAMNSAPQPPVGSTPAAFHHSQVPPMN